MRIKKNVWLALLLAACMLLSGCGSSEAKTAAEDIATVLSSGDKAQIERLIYGEAESDRLQAIEQLTGIPQEVSKSPLDEVFAKVDVSVKKVSSKAITLEVSAPDLRNMIPEMLELGTEITEQNVVDFIEQYLDRAEQTVFKVHLDYSEDDGNVTIDYQNEELANALTGGFMGSYQELCQQAISEYVEELE